MVDGITVQVKLEVMYVEASDANRAFQLSNELTELLDETFEGVSLSVVTHMVDSLGGANFACNMSVISNAEAHALTTLIFATKTQAFAIMDKFVSDDETVWVWVERVKGYQGMSESLKLDFEAE